MTELTEKSLWFSLWLLLLTGGLLFMTVQATPAPVREFQAPLDSASVLTTSAPIKRVVLGNEKIARVQVVSSRQLLVFGKQTGRSTLHIWTENGLRKYLLQIRKLPDNQSTDVLQALDREDTGGEELRVFTPQYREVSEFESYIDQLLGERGEVVFTDSASGKIFVMAPPKVLDRMSRLLDRVDVPGKDTRYTRRVALENRPVNEMKSKVQEMLSESGKVIVDEETNSLMIVDNVDKVQEVVNFLEQIDVRTVAQVRIEAKFVEMTDEAERQIGIDWDYSGSVNGQTAEASMSPSLPAVDSVGGLQLDLVEEAGKNLSATMQFLESEGLANLISSPNVMTRNQQKAKLEIVNERSYTAGWNVSQTDGGGLNVTPIVETKQGGITLTTTPLIGQSDVVQLDLNAELKILDLGDPIVQEAASNEYPFYTPTVDRRTAQLNVALKDGQTLVIGGLNREESNSSTDEVPLLGKIPLIGPMLFGQETDSQQNRKITIFLTADIVELEDNASAEKAAKATEVRDTVPKKVNLFEE